MLRKFNKILLLIIFVALAVRLIGITHGFPFIFHPDEPTIVRSALGVRFNPNPGHFDWPHFYIYLNFFLYKVFAKFRDLLAAVGLKNKISAIFPLIWNDNLIFYFLTRCFSAILGALTVIPVYLAAKNLFGKKAGWFAAACFALLPYHVWHSHYSLPDVPMVFLLSWAMYFASLIIKKPDVKNYLLSGLFVGLSASTKYNGGLSALMIPAAHFLRIFDHKRLGEKLKIIDSRGILALFLSGLAAFVGFIIGTPYALMDYKTFSRTDGPAGAFWQFTNVGSLTLGEHAINFFYDLFLQLNKDTGYVVIPIYVLVLGFLIYRILKKKTDQKNYYLVFLYLISLFFVWYVSGFAKSRSHYYFIFYPFAAVVFGYFVDFLQELLKKKSKFISTALVVLLFAPLFIMSCMNARAFYRGDTRNDLQKWLVKNITPGENVVYNDNTLESVLESVQIKLNKGLENVKNYPKALVVVSDPANDVQFLSMNLNNMKKLVSFSSSGKLGSDIEVYEYSNLKK